MPEECVWDAWHSVTASFNNHINRDHNYGFTLEIISQLFIDI